MALSILSSTIFFAVSLINPYGFSSNTVPSSYFAYVSDNENYLASLPKLSTTFLNSNKSAPLITSLMCFTYASHKSLYDFKLKSFIYLSSYVLFS